MIHMSLKSTVGPPNFPNNCWGTYGIGGIDDHILWNIHMGVNIYDYKSKSAKRVCTAAAVQGDVTNMRGALVDIFTRSLMVFLANCFH